MKVIKLPEKAGPVDILEAAKAENFSHVVVIGVGVDCITTLSDMDDPLAHWIVSQAQYCLVRSEFDG